ncbi:MAG: diguanylate cyclase [Marinobacter sp.]|nr:diguanylate cyclase [Marinobacter sp.]
MPSIPPTNPVPEPVWAHDSKPLTLLIVDDDAGVIQLLSTLLLDKGEAHFARSGEQALTMADRLCPDLILLDMEMPGMSGLEVCRALQANPHTAQARIIFITAHADSEAELGAFEAGAVDYITKPFRALLVAARVDTHLALIRQTRAIEELVHRDGLTGLYNRRFLDRQLETEFLRHSRQGLPLGLALLDIDFFKVYNDSYGHLQGDDCLRRVAGALMDSIRRPGEIVARFGGEEFAIVLPHTDADQLATIGHWLCSRIKELGIVHEHSPVAPCVTISVGLACLREGDPSSVRMLVHRADRALYEAKARGRDGFHVTLDDGS